MSEEQQEQPLKLATDLGAEVGKEAGPRLLELARAAMLNSAGKPGTQTSEFKLAALGLVGALGLAGFGAYTGNPALIAQGVELGKWCIAGYAGARGMSKLGVSMATKRDGA